VPTARWRALPDFIVIGAQKAGTTSLYRYLCDLPDVARPFGQEPVFFSHELKYGRGVDEYRTNFPLQLSLSPVFRRGSPRITGEASGEYLYYPAAPQRVFDLVSGVRLIAVLRDPVERTISQYFHNLKLGFEELSFEDALHRELAWHEEENPNTGAPHRRFGPLGNGRAYLGRSMYAEHLSKWFDRFDPSQLLVLEAEALYSDPACEMSKVCDFLEVRPPRSSGFARHNPGDRAKVDEALTEWLDSVFYGPNKRLEALLNNRLGERAPHLRWVR
jgi:hypothetical protein